MLRPEDRHGEDAPRERIDFEAVERFEAGEVDERTDRCELDGHGGSPDAGG